MTPCGLGNWNPIINYIGSSFDLNWTVPVNDEYAFLFFTRYTYGPDLRIFFEAQTITTSTLSLITPTNTTETVSMFVNETQIANSTTQHETPFMLMESWPYAAIVAMGLVIIGIAAYKRRRNS